ncbi:MAG: 5'-nucleotidase C-terminal domain-containing protein [Shimia sp.]
MPDHGTDRSPSSPIGTVAELSVLATSDLHAHVMGWDYYADRPRDDMGLERLLPVIARLRRARANVLLVDNGDTIQGSPLGDWIEGHACPADEAHPMVAMMNRLGVDAATLGNHEFDFGLDFLGRAMARADFPVVASNLRRVDGRAFFARRAVLTRTIAAADGVRHRLRIGVLGLCPPQVTVWARRHLHGLLIAEDIVTSAAQEAERLRAEGAEIVVALAHTGIGATASEPGGAHNAENAAAAVAALPGIDAVVAGHVHQTFPGPAYRQLQGADLGAGRVAGTPVAMPGFWGSHLAELRIALTLTRSGWRATGGTGAVHPAEGAAALEDGRPPSSAKAGYGPNGPAVIHATEDVPTHPDRVDGPPDGVHETHDIPDSVRRAHDIPDSVRRAHDIPDGVRRAHDIPDSVRRAHDATVAHVRAPVGRAQIALRSHMARVADVPLLRMMSSAQLAAARPIVPAAHRGQPLLSAVAPFKAGGRLGAGQFTEIPAGTVQRRHLADLYPFPNRLALVEVTGLDLMAWLEFSATQYRRLRPGAGPAPLIWSDRPAYNHDTIHGLDYAIDVSRPARDGRVRRLRHRGAPVRPTDRFLVATTDYRAAGGGSVPGVREGRVVAASPGPVRAALRALLDAGPIAPDVPPAWTLAPVEDATGTILLPEGTIDAAQADAPHLPLMPIGTGKDGTTRVGIALGRIGAGHNRPPDAAPIS